MPNTLGSTTKTTFYKGVEAHKLHEEFEVEGLKQTITFDAALITANVINGNVGGSAIAAVTFATNSDATMAAVAAAILLMPGVASVEVVSGGAATNDDRVINVFPIDQVSGVALTGFVVTAGVSQAGIVIATVNNNVKAGMPVEIDATTGKIKPLAGDANLTCIGIALHDATHNEMATVAVKGYAILYAQSFAAMNYGPVVWKSYNTTTLYNVYDDGATTTNQMGWAIDNATAAGETIRVIIK